MSIEAKYEALRELAQLAVELVVVRKGEESDNVVAQLMDAALDLAETVRRRECAMGDGCDTARKLRALRRKEG